MSAPVQHDPLPPLTRDQQVTLLSGATDWETASIPAAGITSLRFSDGPSGIRGLDWLNDTSMNVPCASAIGATWDITLTAEIGTALAMDARRKSVDVHLAPVLNTHRTPVGGRNFEMFAEDPFLVGRIGVAYIQGVRRGGVLSCPKHLVGNDTETDRLEVDSRIDERTLREVYLRPFEMAIADGDVAAVMVAYNRLNGLRCSESEWLLEDALRAELGFDGVAVSDWYCVRSTVEALVAGTDLEMPGPSRFRGELLTAAIAARDVDPQVVQRSADRIVRLAGRVAAARAGATSPDLDADAQAGLALRAAADSFVLLRNRDDVLPLSVERLTSLAVIGPNARTGQLNGGGSAIVRPGRRSDPLDALRTRLAGVDVRHAVGCTIDRSTPLLDPKLCHDLRLAVAPDPAHDWDAAPPGAEIEEAELDTTKLLWFEDPFARDAPPSFSARMTTWFEPDRTGTWVFGIRSIGDASLRIDGRIVLDNESVPEPEILALGKPEMTVEVALEAGRRHHLDARLVRRSDADGLSALLTTAAAPADERCIDGAVAVAASADVAVLVVGTNPDWESEGRDRTTLALPGDQDALVAAVAAVAPRTIVVVNAGAPVAMPWLDDVDAVIHAWFPGQAFGEALADVLTGDREPGGRLPITFPADLEQTPTHGVHPPVDGVAEYTEGRLVGHRWYDRAEVEPLFAFGSGSGYTTFELGGAELVDPSLVRVTAANTGSRDGKVVVQVYAQRSRPAEDDPRRQLAGFASAVIRVGDGQVLDVPLDPRTGTRFDPATGSWVPDATVDALAIGMSSRELRLTMPWPPAWSD